MSEQPRTRPQKTDLGREVDRVLIGTKAGRRLMRQMGLDLRTERGQRLAQAIVAIEAEATTTVPADAWQAGYEACWNRLKDAGRLLPSDGATAAVPLDVERLARALHQNCTFVRLSPHPLDRCERCTREARALSAKYDRLSEGVTA